MKITRLGCTLLSIALLVVLAGSAARAGTNGGDVWEGMHKQGPYELGFDGVLTHTDSDGNAGVLTWVYPLNSITLGANSTQIVDYVSAGLSYRLIGYSRMGIPLYEPMPMFEVIATFAPISVGDEWAEVVKVRFKSLGVDPSENQMQSWAGGAYASNADIHLYEFEIQLDGQWKSLFDIGVPIHGTFHPHGFYDANFGTAIVGTGSPMSKCMRGQGYKPHHPVYSQWFTKMFPACVKALSADYCGDGDSHTEPGRTVFVFDRFFITRPSDADLDQVEADSASLGSPSDPFELFAESVFTSNRAERMSHARYAIIEELVLIDPTLPYQCSLQEQTCSPTPIDQFACGNGADIPVYLTSVVDDRLDMLGNYEVGVISDPVAILLPVQSCSASDPTCSSP